MVYQLNAVLPVDERLELRIVSSDGGGNPVEVESTSDAKQETISVIVAGKGSILSRAGDDEADVIEIVQSTEDEAVLVFINGEHKGGKEMRLLEEVRVSGGGGDDTIKVDPNLDPRIKVKITGDEGRDIIHGEPGDDCIWGGPGKDRIFGHGGDDQLFGEGGTDRIKGGDGQDFISGGKKLDYLRGEGGKGLNDTVDPNRPYGRNDHIQGGRGRDRIWGHAGNDLIFGGEGADTIRGGMWGDRIYGGRGNDRIYGQGGNDKIAGGGDADEIEGGSGENWISGGDGDDEIEGGGEKDRLWGDWNSGTPFGRPSFPFPSNEEHGIKVWIGSSPDDEGRDTIKGHGGGDRIWGGKGDDPELNGGDGEDRIFGGDGDDYLYGEEGKDLLFGGGGRDSVYGGLETDHIWGGDEVGDGDRRLDGEEGGDYIFGGGGDDQIRGESGEDWLYGQDGDDTIDGGTGEDRIWGGDDPDRRLIHVVGEYEDRIYRGDRDDVISGGDGDYRDVIRGNEGDDRIWGGDGGDLLKGGDGRDELDGGDGNDELWGGEGVDELEGDDGNDELWVEAGDGDIYDGGNDNDVYVVSNDSRLGLNYIQESGGSDTLTFELFEHGGVELDLWGGEHGNVGTRLAVVEGRLNMVFEGVGSIEKLIGTNQRDEVYCADWSPLTIEGRGGDDSLQAGYHSSGLVRLFGGSGNDLLRCFGLGEKFASPGTGDGNVLEIFAGSIFGSFKPALDLSQGSGGVSIGSPGEFCRMGGTISGYSASSRRYLFVDKFGDPLHPSSCVWDRMSSKSAADSFGVLDEPRKKKHLAECIGEKGSADFALEVDGFGGLSVSGSHSDENIRIRGTSGDLRVQIGAEVQSVFEPVQRLILRGRGGDDEIVNETDLPALIFGGPGDDRLVGGSGEDSIRGGMGVDVLLGGDGDDYLEGGDGDDVIGGGDGDDLLSGGLGNDTLNGRRGDDELVGAGGADVLVGGEGRDQHDGGTGNDTIDTRDGGFGNDHVVAGAGRDTVWRDRPVVPPLTGVADEAVTLAGTPVNVRVLQNDVGGRRGSVVVKEVTDGEFGTVDPLDAAHPNVMVYTPDPGFVGVDEFTYVIGDGAGQESDADVTVEVLDPGQVAITRKPVLMAPTHRRTDVRRLATFQFSRMRKPTEYVLRLYEPGGTEPWRIHVIPSPETGPVELTIPGEQILPGLKKIEWTVTGRNAAGLGPESARRTMTTRRALVTEAPEIREPGPDTTVDPEAVVFRFTNPEAATGFRLRLFRDDPDERVRLIEVDASPGEETVVGIATANALRGNRRYWVSVLPLAGETPGPVSEKIGFLTGPRSIREAPRLISPKTRPGVALQPVFKIENLAVAEEYEFVVYAGTETNEIARVRIPEGADGRTVWDYATTGELLPATPHWWTAAGVNSAGEAGVFAEKRLFRTDADEGLDTVLSVPADDAKKVSVTPTLQWEGGPDAIRWNVWIWEPGN